MSKDVCNIVNCHTGQINKLTERVNEVQCVDIPLIEELINELPTGSSDYCWFLETATGPYTVIDTAVVGNSFSSELTISALASVIGSTFSSNKIGAVGFEVKGPSSDSTYTGNQISAGGVGLLFSEPGPGSVVRNTISGNNSGGPIAHPAGSAGGSTNIVTGNFTPSGYPGWTTFPTVPNELMSDGGVVFTPAAGMNRLP